MMEIIKKIFAVLSTLPIFTNLFKKASQTGKVDPIEALDALSSISPSTKKLADVAINTAKQGGNVADAARAIKDIGKINVFGQEMDTRTMTQDLKNAGGICATLANMLDKMQHQSPEEIIKFGNAASEVKNWKEIINQ